MKPVMFSGGAEINGQMRYIIRFAGLIIPPVLFAYGLLVDIHLIEESSAYSGFTIFLLLASAWMLVAAYQFIVPIRNHHSALLVLGLYHVFALLYMLLITGFNTPFLAGWVLLFMASYLYFSYAGLYGSFAILALAAVFDSILHPEYIAANTMSGAMLIIVGMAAIAIGKVQERNEVELTASRAQENLQRDRILTLVNNLADGILSTDNDGVIRVYNAASLNLLDTNSSLNGHHIDEIMNVSDQNGTTVSLFKQLKKARGVIARDDLQLTIDGEVTRLDITLSPIRSGFDTTKQSNSGDGYIVIMRDITKAKSLEEERDEFISVVSHELRTPITITEGTISNVQLMMDRGDMPQDKLKTAMKDAHNQVLYLAKMVNDLSTLSRAERGVADEPETISVRSMIEDLYNEYAPQAEAKQLQFDLDLSSHLGDVVASRLYLKELLQNFVTNAIKYTKEGSVTLKVTRTDDAVSFEVSDTGIGISKNDQTKIYNKFYRSEDYRTRETGGTGLGLYVAVKLAKKLGTKIVLSSRLNHGSKFGITIPATPRQTNAKSRPMHR